jgi:ABC-type nitrate/sulfonate/bicarbonate transport system ATPase subunit
MLEVRIQSKAFAVPSGAVRQILRDVTFKAEAGEVVALLGPSGVGKSTILRIVLGLDGDFQGVVRLNARQPGVVFQEPRLPQWLSVEDNLRLVQPTADVGQLLGEVMLPGVEKLLPSALSLGMARRVALARALAFDPDALVLDEPFASLDRGLGAALGALVAARARRQRMLVLLSLHDIDQALAIASRILVLAGDPATLVDDIAVPGDGNRAGTKRDLLARFAFLDSSFNSPDPGL